MEKETSTKVIPLEIDLDGMHYTGEAVAGEEMLEGMPKTFSVGQNKKIHFHIEQADKGWQVVESKIVPQAFVEKIGDYLNKHYI